VEVEEAEAGQKIKTDLALFIAEPRPPTRLLS
jgi:hypothetical protein